MFWSLLTLSIALTLISAAVQVAGKLYARKQINRLRAQLAEARQRHRCLMVEYYLRQHFLCRALGLELPAKPAALRSEEEVAEEAQPSRWHRLLRRKPQTTLTQGSTGSARFIVGRHSFSVVSSIIWRNISPSVMRVVQPVGLRLIEPFAARTAVLAPRLAMLGGGGATTTGSIFASTAARFALSGIAIVGIVLGPTLAAWTVFSELRKVRKAKLELHTLLAEQEAELTATTARNRELEARWAGAREAVSVAG